MIFERDRVLLLCSLGAEIAAAAHFPLFLFRPIALCRGCAQAGHGGEGQQQWTWGHDTKPRPPLAPGETRAYPVLPLRDIVVFPHMIAPLFVGRKKSILALEEVIRSDTFILLTISLGLLKRWQFSKNAAAQVMNMPLQISFATSDTWLRSAAWTS
jgi:hypothetical protein